MKNALPELADLPMVGEGELAAPGRLDVDIWWYCHGTGVAFEQMEAMLALLSLDEREHFMRLRDEHRRKSFLVGRALSRRALSRYASVRPEDWRFGLGNRGKPSIVSPALSLPLWFSLSHAAGVSVCAVTGAGPEIGIDVERIASGRDALEITTQFFPASEANGLRRMPPARRDEAFVQHWALKESFAKAREAGLTEVLSGTSFDLGRMNDIRVVFAESLGEKTEQWQFRLFRLEKALILAIGLRAPTLDPLRLRAGKFLSLT